MGAGRETAGLFSVGRFVAGRVAGCAEGLSVGVGLAGLVAGLDGLLLPLSGLVMGLDGVVLSLPGLVTGLDGVVLPFSGVGIGLVTGLDGVVFPFPGSETPGLVTGRCGVAVSLDGLPGFVASGRPVAGLLITGLPVLSKEGSRLFPVATVGFFFRKVLYPAFAEPGLE